MKKGIAILIGLVMVLAASGIASAATATATLNVSATVEAECTVSTTAVDFGVALHNDFKLGTGDITVTCSSQAPYAITLDAGSNYDGNDYRRLSNGAVAPAFLNYILSGNSSNIFGSQWGRL